MCATNELLFNLFCIICIMQNKRDRTKADKGLKCQLYHHLSYLAVTYWKPCCKPEIRKQQPISSQNRCQTAQSTCILTNSKTNDKVPKKLSYWASQITEQYKPQLIRVCESEPFLSKQKNKKRKRKNSIKKVVLRAKKQKSEEKKKIRKI